jgi:hypothetical protein
MPTIAANNGIITQITEVPTADAIVKRDAS